MANGTFAAVFQFVGTFLTNTYTHTTVNGLLSGTNWVGRYHKIHSPTHTHPDHQTSLINFLHLMNHSILCVQFMCFRDLFHNLSPGPLWSGTHYFILHTFLTMHATTAARLSDNKGVQFSGKGVLPSNTEIITRPTSPSLVTICQINLAKLIPSQFS